MGGLYALVSAGFAIIFGVIRIVNFAHGEFLMLGMYAAFWVFRAYRIDPYVTALVLVPCFFVLGLVAHRLFVRPLLTAPVVAKFFAMLGLSVMLQNLALLLWTSDFRAIITPYSTSAIQIADLSFSIPRLLVFGASVVLCSALAAFLKWTYFGKAIRATVQNVGVAVLLGINIYRVYAVAFGIGIACAGVAGAFMITIYQVFPSVGLTFTLVAVVVVVLGGMGSVSGAFIGGLLIGLVESFSGFYIGPGFKEAVYFLIFIIILIVKPAGIFGIAGSEELGIK